MKNLQTNQKSDQHHYHLIPLIFILVIIPIISRAYVYDPKLSQFDWFPHLTEWTDIFLYYKSVFFTITAVVMAFMILGKRFIEDQHAVTAIEFYPLALYAGLALLSTLFSQYRSYGFAGIYEQFESIWVLLGYCIAAYYAYIFVEEDDVAYLMRWFLVGIALSTALGLSQALSHDFFRTELGQKIVTSGTQYNSLDFNFEKDRVYMSLYNPNYVGSYIALVFPVLVCFILFFKTGKTANYKLVPILECIASLLMAAGLAFCLIKSASKSGIIAVAATFFLFFLILIPRMKKYWYLGILALVVMIGGIFFADRALNHLLSDSIQNLFSKEKTIYALESITVTDKDVVFLYNGDELHFRLTENFDLEVTDAAGTSLPLEKSDGFRYAIADKRFSDITISQFPIEEHMSMGIDILDNTWYFSNDNETGEYLHYNLYGKWTKFKMAPSAVFTGREYIATNRGYIWSRTIPLLKKYILLGSGADTFSLVYPNDDYLGMSNCGYTGQTITKPHNLYLQIGVQTGVISLLAFLAFYLIYFISSFLLYSKCKLDSYSSKVGLGIFIGSFGYMVSGIINDSMITVAPIFWAMIGIGISINMQLKNQKYKATE